MQEILKSLFRYNNDGTLTWILDNTRGFNKTGQQAGTPHKGRMYVKSKFLPVKNMAVSRINWIIHHGEIPEGRMVDHKDRNPMNNRISNLRLLTNAENCANSVGKNTKKSNLPKGVYNCTEPGKYRFQAVRQGTIVPESVFSTDLATATEAAEQFFKSCKCFVKEEDLT